MEPADEASSPPAGADPRRSVDDVPDRGVSDLLEAKTELRRRVREQRRDLDPSARSSASSRVCELVLALPELAGASGVLLYGASPEELDPAAVAARVRGRGGRTLYPRVAGDELEVVEVTDDTPLVAGYLGILEPEGEPLDPTVVDAVVVPGIAFDAHGRRLGQGKGFYDRLLPRIDGPRIAVGFACQLVDEVPADGDDTPVDVVVTDNGVVRTGARPDAGSPTG